MPVDGLVLSGKSHADESMLTGEAEPVLKSEGNAVIGGTMNLGGTLQVPSCLHAPHWVPSCRCWALGRQGVPALSAFPA